MSKLDEIILNGTSYDIDGSGVSLSLGIDPIDGLMYIYVNGVKQGTGVEIPTGEVSTNE